MKISRNAALTAPLITPEMLLNARVTAFANQPRKWLRSPVVVTPGDPISELNIEIQTEQGTPYECAINILSLGILFELTRPGNKVFGNSNRGVAPQGKHQDYLKLRFDGDDNVIVNRLVKDAGRGAVVLRDRGSRDATPHTLELSNTGPAIYDARPKVRRWLDQWTQAQVLKSALSTAQIAAYLQNLEALYQVHDGIFPVSSDEAIA
jgi:hypothetical protein